MISKIKLGEVLTAEAVKALVAEYGIQSLHLDDIYVSDAQDALALVALIRDDDTFCAIMHGNDPHSLSILSQALIPLNGVAHILSFALKGIAMECLQDGQWAAYETKPCRS